MVEKCGGGIEANAGGGEVRVLGGRCWSIWLGVLGIDVERQEVSGLKYHASGGRIGYLNEVDLIRW